MGDPYFWGTRVSFRIFQIKKESKELLFEIFCLMQEIQLFEESLPGKYFSLPWTKQGEQKTLACNSTGVAWAENPQNNEKADYYWRFQEPDRGRVRNSWESYLKYPFQFPQT